MWGSVLGQENFERFAILGYARTGSSFLASGLDSSTSTRLYKEIFAEHNRKIGNDFEKILSNIYQKQHRSIKTVGFKLFYYHLTEDEWKKFLRYEDVKIIHITRRNILRTIVSLDIAFKTNKWHTSFFTLRTADKKVSLNAERLVQRIEEILEYEEVAHNRFKDRDIVEIVYENLIDNPKSEFERVRKFLNINSIDPEKITLRKQNPEKLSELIENYEEVSQALAGTKYAHFLID